MLLGFVFSTAVIVSLPEASASWYENLPQLDEDAYASLPAGALYHEALDLSALPFQLPETALLPLEPGLFDPYLNDEFTAQFEDTARGTYDGASDRIGSFMSLGLDLEKRFRDVQGVAGQLTLQASLVQADDLFDPLLLFHEVNDWEIQWLDTYYNYTGFDNDLINVRVGHFDVPFGLEPTVDEHGSLRSFLHAQNFGFREDWGIALNGGDDLFNYEAGWTRGSGNDYRTDGDPGVASGRIGASPGRNIQAGVSYLDGRTLNARDPNRRASLVDRQRVGLDFQAHHRGFGLMTEASVGTDENEDVRHELVELNWTPPYDESLTWLQLRNESRNDNGWDDFVAATFGVEMPVSGAWTFSAEWTQQLEAFQGDSRIGYLSMQLRMRF